MTDTLTLDERERGLAISFGNSVAMYDGPNSLSSSGDFFVGDVAVVVANALAMLGSFRCMLVTSRGTIGWVNSVWLLKV